MDDLRSIKDSSRMTELLSIKALNYTWNEDEHKEYLTGNMSLRKLYRTQNN